MAGRTLRLGFTGSVMPYKLQSILSTSTSTLRCPVKRVYKVSLIQAEGEGIIHGQDNRRMMFVVAGTFDPVAGGTRRGNSLEWRWRRRFTHPNRTLKRGMGAGGEAWGGQTRNDGNTLGCGTTMKGAIVWASDHPSKTMIWGGREGKYNGESLPSAFRSADSDEPQLNAVEQGCDRCRITKSPTSGLVNIKWRPTHYCFSLATLDCGLLTPHW
jgi:hypothetical protein